MRYNANTGNDGTYYLFGTAEESFLGVDRGEKVTLQLYATSADYNNGGITRHEPVKSATNVYVTKDKAPTNHASLTKFGTTDSSGKITLDTSKLAPGLYYVTTNTWDPAVVVLEVFGDIVYGDLTGDGEVDVFDASRAYAIVNGKRTATEAELAAIDVNGDEDIDVFDAAMIYAYANGKRSSFPVESK